MAVTDKVNPVQIQKFLEGADYPMTKKEIIELATKNDADENVISTLQNIPDGTYDSPIEITKAIGSIE